MVVKNEADIIEYTINRALNWASYIVIMDNNSSDETTDIIKRLSARNEKIIFWGRYEGAFRDSLRAIVFNDYKHLSKPGDWWCRLDADEIYIDNPLDFIAEANSCGVDHIYSASFQYYLTKNDSILLEETPSEFAPERYSYYKCDWSEIRFVKITTDTIWPLNFAQPLFLRKPSLQRIKLKHYQYRSIQQMQKRYNDRAPVAGKKLFSHELNKNKLWEVGQLNKDEGIYEFNDEELPKIKEYSFVRKLLFTTALNAINILNVRRIFEPSKEKV